MNALTKSHTYNRVLFIDDEVPMLRAISWALITLESRPVDTI